MMTATVDTLSTPTATRDPRDFVDPQVWDRQIALLMAYALMNMSPVASWRDRATMAGVLHPTRVTEDRCLHAVA